MNVRCRKIYRKLFSSHTTHKGWNITSLSDDNYRSKDYNFHFISSASLSLISATFFIGLLSVNIKSISTVAFIELFMSMLFFSLSISINAFFLFYLFMSLNDESDKVSILITLKYRFFALMKLLSFVFPALGMLSLLLYLNEFIAIISFSIFFILLLCYSKVMSRAERKAYNILK